MLTLILPPETIEFALVWQTDVRDEGIPGTTLIATSLAESANELAIGLEDFKYMVPEV